MRFLIGVALYFGVALLLLAKAAETDPAKDAEIQQKAEAAVEEFCTDGSLEPPDGVADGKEHMDGILDGNNAIIEVAKKSKDNTEFSAGLTNEIAAGMQGQILAFFLAAVTTLVSWFFVCSACPCCKRCRVCRGRHENPIWLKGAFIAPVLIVVLVAVVGLAGGTGGASDMQEGLDHFSCSIGWVLASSLGNFNGYLKSNGEVSLNLDDNSLWMVTLEYYFIGMDGENELIQKWYKVNSSLHTMRLFLEEGETDDDTTELQKKLQDAQNQLDGSPAGVAANVYHSLLSDPDGKVTRDILKAILSVASLAVGMLKTMLVTTFGPVVEGGGLDQLKVLNTVVLMTFLVLLATIACGGVGTVFWVVRETGSDGRHNKTPHRCNCCSWYWSLPIAMFFFIIGGILSGLGPPMAGLCELMDDLNGNLLDEVGPALGVETTGQEGQNLKRLVDMCINPPDPTVKSNILDLTEDANGNTVNHYIQDIIKPIKNSFEQSTNIDAQCEDVTSASCPLKELVGLWAGVTWKAPPPCVVESSPETGTAPVIGDPNAGDACLAPAQIGGLLDTRLGDLPDVSDSVRDNIKNVVNMGLIDPLDDNADLPCDWLVTGWQGVVDGLCYQTIYGTLRIGNAYLVSAYFCFLFAISAYVVWRRTIDNVNADDDEPTNTAAENRT